MKWSFETLNLLFFPSASPKGSARSSLFPDFARRVAILNGTPSSIGSNALKPWDSRMDETKFIESDSDDQLIITVPFTGNVKLREILIKAGPAGQTPEEIHVWPNKESESE